MACNGFFSGVHRRLIAGLDYGYGAAAAMMAGALLCASACAQTYPSKSIRFIVPNPPGGGTDFVARLVALKLPELIGENVIVDNRAGAAGLVGTELAARAPADEYTLLLADSSCAINASYYKNAKYDTLKSFDPLTDVADTFYILAVYPALPAATVNEFIALAKAQPGKINFGSPGNGTAGHLTGALFILKAGVNLTHIPYKGGGPATADVVAGQIQATFGSAPSTLPFIKAGRLKALAATSPKRSTTMPDVPTFVEAGFKDIAVTNWYGIVSLGGTPKPVLDKLNAALQRVIAMPDVQERLASVGLEPAPMSREAFRHLIAEEFTRWAAVVRDAGIKPE